VSKRVVSNHGTMSYSEPSGDEGSYGNADDYHLGDLSIHGSSSSAPPPTVAKPKARGRPRKQVAFPDGQVPGPYPQPPALPVPLARSASPGQRQPDPFVAASVAPLTSPRGVTAAETRAYAKTTAQERGQAEQQEKIKYLNLIEQYYSRLGAHIKTPPNPHLTHASPLLQIKAHLQMVQADMEESGRFVVAERLFITALRFPGAFMPSLASMDRVAAAEYMHEVSPILDELVILYFPVVRMGPVGRLIAKVGQIAQRTMEINTDPAKLAEFERRGQQQAPASWADTFGNL